MRTGAWNGIASSHVCGLMLACLQFSMSVAITALVGACEQSIFEVEGERTDGALDGVVVEIDAAIVEEVDEAVPARERVADRLADTAFGLDLSAACFEEPIEIVDDRTAALVAGAATLVSR